MSQFKDQIHRFCMQVIGEKLAVYRQDLAELQFSANEETKSSMGDKYETSREMLQQEIDKISKQLSETIRMKQTLANVTPPKHDKIGMGSLVITDKGSFYITVSLGQLKMEEFQLVVISPAAPLARLMMGLSVGDHFEFNQKKYMVTEVIN